MATTDEKRAIGANPMRRAFKLLFVLQGHTVHGQRLKQIAERMQESACTTLRDLTVMEEEGMAERITGKEEYWRLTPKLAQVAVAHFDEIQQAEARLNEINQRYTRQI